MSWPLVASALFTPALLLSLTACSAPAPGSAPQNPTAGPTSEVTPEVSCDLDRAAVDAHAGWVFDQGTVRTYDIRLEDRWWAFLKRNPEREQYVPAFLSVGGSEVGLVGVRIKGNIGTLKACTDPTGAWTCGKWGLKIAFDRYQRSLRLHGLRRLNFNPMSQDPSRLRERLAYWAFREAGLPAPRSVHAEVVVNGESQGLYTVAEQVDEVFLSSRFPRCAAGELYKELWTVNTNDDASHFSAHLPSDTRIAASLRAGSALDYSGVRGFLSEIHTQDPERFAEALAKWVDVDLLLRFLAVEELIGSVDSLGSYRCAERPGSDAPADCTTLNFYWFRSELDGRFRLLPWDRDFTFSPLADEVPRWFEPVSDCRDADQSSGGTRYTGACDLFLQGLATHQGERFRAAIRELIDGPLALERLARQIDTWTRQIAPFVAADGLGPRPGIWRRELIRLEDQAWLRNERLHELLRDSPNPCTTSLPAAGVDFEGDGMCASPSSGRVLGLTELSNANSSVTQRRNHEGVIAGGTDLRIDFTFRDELDGDEPLPLSAWLMLRMPWRRTLDLRRGGDVALSLKIKGDRARRVRINLESAAEASPYSGKRYGWSIDIDRESKRFVLPVSALSYPDWGPPLPDLRDEVTASVQALHVIIERPVTERDERSDTGFVQVDDIIIQN